MIGRSLPPPLSFPPSPLLSFPPVLSGNPSSPEKEKGPGCPIKTVGHDRMCHARHPPLVMPVAPSVIPASFQRESIFNGRRERTLDARLKPSGMTERDAALSCPSRSSPITTVGHDRERPAFLSFPPQTERPVFYFSQHVLACRPRMTEDARRMTEKARLQRSRHWKKYLRFNDMPQKLNASVSSR